jgi:hypothetical protein
MEIKKNENLENNKRKLESDDNTEDVVKKFKTNENNNELGYLLKCEIEVKLLNKIIHLKFDFKDGLSKDFVHQILQFFKNKIEKCAP